MTALEFIRTATVVTGVFALVSMIGFLARFDRGFNKSLLEARTIEDNFKAQSLFWSKVLPWKIFVPLHLVWYPILLSYSVYLQLR